MFIDASALVAILTREEDAPSLFKRYLDADRRLTSGVAIYEAALAVARKQHGDFDAALDIVNRLLARTATTTVAIGAEEAALALDAFARFGKGRHPARLNMGDCFAYACAKRHAASLLYKGGDFALTDIETAG